MPQALPIITLLTDFGDRDWFVASMKGVILSIQPQATIVDLSHQIPAHAVEDGAYVLQAACRYFPPGTIHVAVVDPGVGGARRALAAKSSRFFFLAPDNGLLSRILEEERDVEVREITNRQYQLEPQGRTFDGRDVFAPVAAWLAKSRPFVSCGPVLSDWTRLPVPVPRWEQQALIGEVTYVDRFGNVITNLRAQQVEEVRQVTKRQDPAIQIGRYVITGLVGSYSQGESNRPAALINSNGDLEIFLKGGNAAVLLSAGRHEPVRLT